MVWNWMWGMLVKKYSSHIFRSFLVWPLSHCGSTKNDRRLLLECKSRLKVNTENFPVYTHIWLKENTKTLLNYSMINIFLCSTHLTKKNIFSPPSSSWSISWTVLSNYCVYYIYAFTCLSHAHNLDALLNICLVYKTLILE